MASILSKVRILSGLAAVLGHLTQRMLLEAAVLQAGAITGRPAADEQAAAQ